KVNSSNKEDPAFIASSRLPKIKASLFLRDLMAFMRLEEGSTAPFIHTLSLAIRKGYLADKYFSVLTDTFVASANCHFSRMVSMPILISQTGRIKVKGKSCCLIPGSSAKI